jgi:hypothetical protein
MKLLSLLLSIIFYSTLTAQFVGFDEIDEKTVKPWKENNSSKYAGTYHFGASEAQNDLRIIIDEGEVFCQIIHWDFQNNTWMPFYKNIKSPVIVSDTFKSSISDGKFVTVTHENKTKKGLMVYNPWSISMEKGKYEIGLKTGPVEFYGTYPFTSEKKLSNNDLSKYSKSELQLMRNEIFARYGYIFKSGGKMAEYFSKQSWYKPYHTNVDDFLTKIEKHNIELIQLAENK